jgi:hypothetical protein
MNDLPAPVEPASAEPTSSDTSAPILPSSRNDALSNPTENSVSKRPETGDQKTAESLKSRVARTEQSELTGEPSNSTLFQTKES